MDVNESLRTALENAREIIDLLDRERPDGPGLTIVESNAEKLSESLIAIDEWLSKGGFLPERWKRPMDSGRSDWPAVRE